MSSSAAAAAQPWRKPPPPLHLLCEVSVVKLIHGKAAIMEQEYMDKWNGELTKTNRVLEETINIRKDVSTEEIVLKYESAASEEARLSRFEACAAAADADAGRRRGRKARGGAAAAAATATKRRRGAPPPKPPEPDIKPPRKKPRVIKCKYIEDIKNVRMSLLDRLTAEALNGVMDTMYNIAQFNNKHEHGLLTLQAMLMNHHIKDFSIAPVNFYKNFVRSDAPYSSSPQPSWPGGDHLETRIGTTILHFMIAEGHQLTHLRLEKCACDSLLTLASESAPNLTYLNVSGSLVSDAGLLALCGLEKHAPRTRPKLSRQCKGDDLEDGNRRLVANETPRWRKKKPGCEKLIHLEAYNLQCLQWPGKAGPKYYDYPSVPLDCGFVAALLHLPSLQVLLTEVGGRAVAAAVKAAGRLKRPGLAGGGSSPTRGSQRRRGRLPLLAIRVLSDDSLTPTVFHTVRINCPDLRDLRVDWNQEQFFAPVPVMGELALREDWLPCVVGCAQLRELRTRYIDFTHGHLPKILSSGGVGLRLTLLDFRELWRFKYSNFRAIRNSCINLKYLGLFLTTKNVYSSIQQIGVDKDCNLNSFEQAGKSLPRLRELRNLHLTGPLSCEVVKFFLAGADQLNSLTLGLEWLDPAFSDAMPENRKDFLGQEFFEELLSLNSLSHLTELHLLAQYSSSRKYLTKSFADFLLRSLPKLRHLGNFRLWSMLRADIKAVRSRARATNLGVTFDEDLHAPLATIGAAHDHALISPVNLPAAAAASAGALPPFEYRVVAGRDKLACQHIPTRKDTPGIIADFFEVFAGGGGGPNGGGDLLGAADDDDDEISNASDASDLDAIADDAIADDDADESDFEEEVDLVEPVCSVM